MYTRQQTNLNSSTAPIRSIACHPSGQPAFALGFILFARRYWGYHFCFLFHRLMICLSSAGSLTRLRYMNGLVETGNATHSKQLNCLVGQQNRSTRASVYSHLHTECDCQTSPCRCSNSWDTFSSQQVLGCEQPTSRQNKSIRKPFPIFSNDTLSRIRLVLRRSSRIVH